ncbi:FAD:protein FMN transferase [Candidatus Laterigemmans baculatus]|uniref:FAD:protein FMN transferase n=1 Tax=Candidatus Laterigemmans baculatus TaxID=2770505 RepID=UPI0013DD62BA|nr:FAD:protein FMN transferase [Candidatus Laterigemmans baculatus]
MNLERWLPRLVRCSLILCGGIVWGGSLSGCGPAAERASKPETPIAKTTGLTMGTYYSVTIANPPQELPADWTERVDAELRQVNDQMSTYLESSEISRFNRSTSLDWFPVSGETAMVVAVAQEVSAATGGAFDITVGPLVDAWSFGPGKRTGRPPSAAELESLRRKVGYENLEVRRDPPALRKKIPELRIDLSAIAKGHGVDRVLGLLVELGCEHAFVDIGGEDRAIGRRGERGWRVAIEDPNDEQRRYAMAIELNDRAIATSGDYRNFFEFEGRRYSHTIDPRTGRPIEHGVASVSVIANDCMTADAWATALAVVGPTDGLELASRFDLAVRFVVRESEDRFRVVASDTFPGNILLFMDADE